jgi:serine/threonine-protein kinase
MTTRLDPERWRRIGQALDAALAADPEHWPAVLDAACAGAPDVRREVEELLARGDDARCFLESPPVSAAAAVLAEARTASGPEPGGRVGAYRIEREIGRGGMSRVFLAQRADGQFEQRVALKLLRPGLDSDVDRARFRAERQILATLNHPNIARLLDGGLAEGGHPYLVLEYVEGQPIDAYCQERALTVWQRLQLFLMAAEATQYAHRNLVVHRDIKASNIFVSVDGAVKLLDFGLAKLLEPAAFRGDSSPMHTVAHWMTPEYAAPEQIRREPVTTLTDVYQLGVVLYRLLAGRLPFTTAGGNLRELEAAVLRGDPTPPSVALGGSNPAGARLLRGDLDAIVLMAMRRDPAERYASVEALADDIRRQLSGHPVRARRVTATYRARRFVRRHRVETVASLAILISVLAGAGAAVWQARRAAAERDLAQVASRESQAVTSFVMGLFEASDPAVARGDALTAEQLVERAAGRAELLRSQPLAEARMLEVTARLYQSLGQYGKAHAILERAIAIRRSVRSTDQAELAAALDQFAEIEVSLGRYAAGDSTARVALEMQQRALGPRDPAVARTFTLMGNFAIYRGDLAGAEAYHRRAFDIFHERLGADDSLTVNARLKIGATLRREGRTDEAEREFRDVLATRQRILPAGDPQIAEAMLKVAYLLDEDRGRYEEAEPLYRRALEIRRHAYGNASPLVAATLFDISFLQSRRGDHVGAVASARQGLEIARAAYGGNHPVVADFTAALAAALHRAGRLAEAESFYRRAIALDERTRGPAHESVAGVETDLARLLVDRGNYAAADSTARDALRIRTQAAGVNSPNTAATEGLLGLVLTREARYAAADSTLHHAVAALERQVDRRSPDLRRLYAWLADLETARGRPMNAARYRAIADAR